MEEIDLFTEEESALPVAAPELPPPGPLERRCRLCLKEDVRTCWQVTEGQETYVLRRCPDCEEMRLIVPRAERSRHLREGLRAWQENWLRGYVVKIVNGALAVESVADETDWQLIQSNRAASSDTCPASTERRRPIERSARRGVRMVVRHHAKGEKYGPT